MTLYTQQSKKYQEDLVFDDLVFDCGCSHRLGVFSSLWQFVFCGYRRDIQLIYEFFQLLVFGQNSLGDVRS